MLTRSTLSERSDKHNPYLTRHYAAKCLVKRGSDVEKFFLPTGTETPTKCGPATVFVA